MIALNLYFPATTSTTLETRSVRIPTGTWRLVEAAFTPSTTAAAGDGSNNCNVTLSSADGAGGSPSLLSTLTGNAVAFTINVPRAFSISPAGTVLTGGQVLILAKTVTGTGGTIDGDLSVVLEKVN
jgi:hypothetical protein